MSWVWLAIIVLGVVVGVLSLTVTWLLECYGKARRDVTHMHTELNRMREMHKADWADVDHRIEAHAAALAHLMQQRVEL